jgi:hypothetical protein
MRQRGFHNEIEGDIPEDVGGIVGAEGVMGQGMMEALVWRVLCKGHQHHHHLPLGARLWL